MRRTGTLRNVEVTKLYGIPPTTAVSTLVDLAASVSARELEQSLAQALARRLTTRAQLERVLVRANGRRGSARLRALLDGKAKLLRLIRKAQLPEPTGLRVVRVTWTVSAA